jgi:hypothetical protein
MVVAIAIIALWMVYKWWSPR